jgi:hypothetical protein
MIQLYKNIHLDFLLINKNSKHSKNKFKDKYKDLDKI